MTDRRIGPSLASLDELMGRAKEYLPADRLPLIERAFAVAQAAHGDQLRKSGEPYWQHPLAAAMTLADLRLDAAAIAAGLLHDVPEDTGTPMSAIEAQFDPEVAKLVDGVTKLSKLEWNPPVGADGRPPRRPEEINTQAENLRKMFIAMAEDIRVVLIKLADRLHNMKTLDALDPAKRQRIAAETMEIYAPLAARLGIWQIKWQLEDLAFRHLEPERYREVVRLIAQRRTQRERYIAQVVRILSDELNQHGIQAEVIGRPKHIYSIYQKIAKYAAQGKEFADIYDLLAVRVLVNSVADCYTTLGIIHNLWRPIPQQFDDYIANPKESMYQSLHTSVLCLGARPLELQIRTYEMHRIAEYGIAAHWRYKQSNSKADARFDAKVAWLRQLLEWQKDLSGAQEFVESLKTDVFQDQVFIYTPKGDIKDMPAGATPLDFAYRIHTDLGHHCVGAKVNGRLVPLDYQLKNADVVEVLTSKNSKGPSRDWLNPALGYIKTSHAKEKIRQWFRRQQRAENVDRGRELVEKELKRLGVVIALDELAGLFRYDKLEDFLAAVGYGDVNAQQITLKIAQQVEKPVTISNLAPVIEEVVGSESVQVMGVGDMLTHLSRCCHPLPGDPIVGYITRTRGVSVHRQDCYNIIHEDETERLVPVEWGSTKEKVFPVVVRIEALDRMGLLRDVTNVVAEERVNMAGADTLVMPDRNTARITLTLSIRGLEQLSRIFAKLEAVRGVLSVVRESSSGKQSASA